MNERFYGPKFAVSETVDNLHDPSRLCAQLDGILPAGAVQYFPCMQGGVLSINRSRLFMPGRYVQITLHPPSAASLHIREMEVHGY